MHPTFVLTISKQSEYSITHSEDESMTVRVTGDVDSHNWVEVPNLQRLIGKYNTPPDQEKYYGWIVVKFTSPGFVNRGMKEMADYGGIKEAERDGGLR